MPFYNEPPKQTKTARPTVAANQKWTAAEINAFTTLFNTNYQEFLDFKTAVENAGLVLNYVRFNANYQITNAGIYVYYGSSNVTLTIDDAIAGVVEVRTVGTGEVTLSGNINSNHLGTIYPSSAATVFRWDNIDLEYNF